MALGFCVKAHANLCTNLADCRPLPAAAVTTLALNLLWDMICHVGGKWFQIAAVTLTQWAGAEPRAPIHQLRGSPVTSPFLVLRSLS